MKHRGQPRPNYYSSRDNAYRRKTECWGRTYNEAARTNHPATRAKRIKLSHASPVVIGLSINTCTQVVEGMKEAGAEDGPQRCTTS